jgi:hypothetical protein
MCELMLRCPAGGARPVDINMRGAMLWLLSLCLMQGELP